MPLLVTFGVNRAENLKVGIKRQTACGDEVDKDMIQAAA